MQIVGVIGYRLVLAIPTVFVVTVFVFVAMRLGPVDPAILLAGENATDADIQAIRESLRLEGGLIGQYLTWVSLIASGDFGRSLYTGQTVVSAIVARAEPTMLIAIATTVLASVGGAALGLLAALRRGSWIDNFVMAGSVVGFSVPVFVLGYLFILLLSVHLKVFPVQGYTPLAEDPWGSIRSITLPALTLTPVYLSLVARITRAAALEVRRSDYVRTAVAKGLSRRRIVLGYILLNSLMPILTAVGAGFALLIGGTVVTETVFSIPGIGRLLVDAMLRRDYPVIQGVILILSFTYVLINLVVDLAYVFIDPRIKV